MKRKMNAKVFSRNNEYGKMDFYLEVNRNVFYLFTTYFSKGIYKEYCRGKRLEEVYSKTSMVRHQKIKDRIIRMSKYMAQENEIDLFKEKSHKLTYKKRKYDDFDYEVA